MRIFFCLIFIMVALLAADDSSSAELAPGLVRIRMQKELESIPVIKGASLRQVGPSLWSLRGEKLVSGRQKLPPSNYVVKNKNGKYDLIAVVNFEDYLAGVVASEMPVNWPLEALKSQAVVARSYALARMNERRDKMFQLEADQGDQVFSDAGTFRTRQAVQETSGVVLLKPDGEVLKAFYHSDCGGETVPAADVWGSPAFDSGTAVDSWCAARKSNEWNFKIAKEEFARGLGLGSVEEGLSEYVHKTQKLYLGSEFFPVQKLREIFGFSNLRGAPDRIEVKAGEVVISGKGFGHGAGLCQWGTRAQARLGKSYLQVLEHYYPKARVSRENYRLSLNSALNWPKNSVSN